MNEQDVREKLAELRAAGKWAEVFDLYLEGWRTGIWQRPMERSDFGHIFCCRACSEKAILMAENHYSRELLFLQQAAETIDLSYAWSYDSAINVLEAYAPERLTDDSLLKEVRSRQGECARDFARHCLYYRKKRKGREASRRLLLGLVSADMSEDVHCEAIDFAVYHDLLMLSEVISLPPRAQHYWRCRTGWPLSRIGLETQLLGVPDDAREVIASLLRTTTLDLQIRRGDFTGREIENLRLMRGENPAVNWRRLLDEPLSRLRDLWDERILPAMTAVAAAAAAAAALPRTDDGLPAAYSVPILRLLHMKALLGTPALKPPSIAPENALLVEVISYLTGTSRVNYDGTLSFAGLTNELRGDYRRKLVEPIGEALAVLFLEDSVGLDLSTLSRIPEAREGSPDFRASASDDRRIVIEAKGASSWDYFQKSIRKAQRQLGKGTGNQRVGDCVFVCRTFIACQDSDRTSRCAANDPPVNTDDYFGKYHDEHALRVHYAGVAQLAGLTHTAHRVLEPADEAPQEPKEDVRRLIIGEQEYIGTSHRLATMALSFGYVLPRGFDRLVVFQGVEGNLYYSLRKGDVHRRGGRVAHHGGGSASPNAEFNDTPAPPAGVGIVPDREGRDEQGQGIYSLATDGSVVAIVTDSMLR